MRNLFISILLLAGLCEPGNALAQPKAPDQVVEKPDAKQPEKAGSQDTAKVVTRQLHLAGQKEFSCPKLALREKTDYGTFLQGYNGWFFREEADFLENFNLFSEARFYMSRLEEALKRRGTTFVFMTIPPRAWVGQKYLDEEDPVMKEFSMERSKRNFQDYLKTLSGLGIVTADLSPYMDQVSKDGEGYFYKRDHHWTPYGSELSAKAMRDAMEKIPEYTAMPKKEYTSTLKEMQEYKLAMAQHIQRICERDLPPEPLPFYVTRLKSTDSADDLFGDADTGSPTILVGTSFSAQEMFNFDGFLQQYLGIEIANFAMAGGGLYNSILSLTSAAEFEEMKPPFFIWEAPSHYDLNSNSSNAFRQIVPGVFGACKGKSVLETHTVSVGANSTTEILNLPPDKKISGANYYIYLNTPNLALAKFTLQMDYDDGDGEWFPIDRSSHFRNTGRFFVELSDEIDNGALTSVSLINPLPVNADIEIRLCAAPPLKNSVESGKKG